MIRKRKVVISFIIDVDNAAYRNKFADNKVDEIAVFNTIERYAERFKYTDIRSIDGTKIKEINGNCVGHITSEIKNIKI